MALTNYPNGISSFGIPVIGSGPAPLYPGPYFFVDGSSAGNGNGSSLAQAFNTIQRAVDAAANQGPGCAIFIAPGDYDEAVTISRPTDGSAAMVLYGLGGKGDVGIAPTAANAGALVNNADDVTLLNIGLAANGTGKALVNTGARLRAFNCKLENDDATGECAQMTLGTVAQRAAGTKGGGADCLFSGCEFAWAASGIEIVCTDYGAVTELQVVNCWFHDLDTKHIYETVGSGGSAAVMYASLLLQNNVHSKDEAGTAPTDYILLNGNNANSGLLAGGVFPQAANGGKVLLSTALICVGCYFTGGISTGQPT